MKKIALSLLALVMILSLAACAGGKEPAGDVDNTDPSQNVTDDTQTEDGTGESDGESSTKPVSEPEKSKILVAYFSATNNTKGVAQKLADGLGADLYEIVPEAPYTSADLDYNSDCRANREQSDDSARPAISGSVENMDDYGIIFLGYPIWWGQAPKIMHTFVESYNLSGKTLVPFCTSGSSDFGDSNAALKEIASSSVWLDGKRFSADASSEEIMEWANGLEINVTRNNEEENTTMQLLINDVAVNVEWESNESVNALKEICANESLAIQMSMYGGFEQVGAIGQTLPREDEQTTTQSGDIVLYSGNQIVVFYGSNSWAYTSLGHITDKSASEMKDLLGNGDVTITISAGTE